VEVDLLVFHSNLLSPGINLKLENLLIDALPEEQGGVKSYI
jgi:hypothetical protein